MITPQKKQQSGFALPLAILIAVVLIVAGGAGYYFYKTPGAEKYSSPEKTYSLYIKAMEKGDVEAYLECFTEASQEMLKPGIERLTPEGLKTLFVEFPKEAEFKVTEKTSDMAVIAIASEKVKGGILFKKEKGNWKIDQKELSAQWRRDDERVSNLIQLTVFLEYYHYDVYGAYPSLTDTSEDGEFLKVLIDEGHMTEMLLDPLHPKYFYEYKGTENSYTLKCYCEIEGGDCDMKDEKQDHAYTISHAYGISVEKKLTEAEKEKLIETIKNLQPSFFPAIKNLTWRVADNEVIITGHAETREDLLKLKEALEEIPQLTEVECPVSTWIKMEDIDFTFTAKF